MQNPERPDGSIVTPIGWVLIIVGVGGAFVGASAETFNGALLGFAIANLGIALGVLLLALGYVVKAIWFLPGRDVAQAASMIPASRASPPDPCGWCGRTLPADCIACTSYDRQTLERVASKVQDPVCKAKLQENGVPSGVTA